jgi:hypothetical protein
MSLTPAFRLRPPLLAWAGVLLIFVFGLSIPRISLLAMFGLFGLAAWQRPTGLRLRVSDAFMGALLALFLLCFLTPSVYYGFASPLEALKDGFMILLSYGAGLLWGRRRTEGASGARMLAAMAAGFTVFAALTTFANPSKAATFINPDRSALNFWNGGNPINGTVLGVYASVGLCLFPLVFLRSGERKNNGGLGWQVAALLVASLGFVSNLIMQNRSPYFALTASFLVCSAIYLQRQAGGPGKRSIGLLLRLSPLLLIILILMIQFPDFMTNVLFRRFETQGTDTGGRTMAWLSVIRDLPSFPFGGKVIDIGGLSYAHNLWLDVAYDSGLIALLALLAFHLAHLPFWWRFYRSRHAMAETLVVSAIGVSMLMGCIGEPTLDASRLYFGGTCFLLGWVKSRAVAGPPFATNSNTRD